MVDIPRDVHRRCVYSGLFFQVASRLLFCLAASFLSLWLADHYSDRFPGEALLIPVVPFTAERPSARSVSLRVLLPPQAAQRTRWAVANGEGRGRIILL